MKVSQVLDLFTNLKVFANQFCFEHNRLEVFGFVTSSGLREGGVFGAGVSFRGSGFCLRLGCQSTVYSIVIIVIE